jgi:hypothetical protein
MALCPSLFRRHNERPPAEGRLLVHRTVWLRSAVRPYLGIPGELVVVVGDPQHDRFCLGVVDPLGDSAHLAGARSPMVGIIVKRLDRHKRRHFPKQLILARHNKNMPRPCSQLARRGRATDRRIVRPSGFHSRDSSPPRRPTTVALASWLPNP